MLGVVALVVLVAAMVDMLMIERSRVRGVPKPVWAVIILVPVIGALLWFLIGRDRPQRTAAPRTLAPDDDPDFLDRVRRESDETIARLERELAELDDDQPPSKD